MIVEIFKDQNLEIRIVNESLIEGEEYFIKVTPHSESLIEREIKSGFSSAFYDWIPANNIGKIRFRNVIGKVRIFNNYYDIKSSKFLETSNGEDQLKVLLEEITSISNEFVMEPTSASGYKNGYSQKEITNNVYYIYKYLMNSLFSNQGYTFLKAMDSIMTFPSFKQIKKPEKVEVFRAKSFSMNTFSKMVQGSIANMIVPIGHTLNNSSFVRALPRATTGEAILPRKIYSSINEKSYDTPENRFILFFLNWCQSIFQITMKKYPGYQIKEDCEAALNLIKRYRYRKIFSDVGILSSIPTTSSVLLNKYGYKEIYHYFLKCRSKPKLFSDELKEYYSIIEIKEIPVLYEYWIYFKIAEIIFGSDSKLDISKRLTSSGKLDYGFVISDNKKALYYNKTYSYKSGDSYSFNFRPDVSLEIIEKNKVVRIFFDAKYSNSSLPSSEEIEFTYKNINVVKMLSYMESINGSMLAVIVYPGSDFLFYEKYEKGDNAANVLTSRISNPLNIKKFRGVGAVQLSPGNDDAYAVFSEFMKKLMKEFSLSEA